MLQALRQLAHHAASGLLDALIKLHFKAGSEKEWGLSLGLTGGADRCKLHKTVDLQPALKVGTCLSRLPKMAGHAHLDE